jgi:putative hydrolase of HD superfamily
MNKKEMDKFLNETYKLKSLMRYNTTPRLVNESIAEHMFFVTIIVHKLYDYYSFDLHIAMKMAVFHDIPEIFLSDVPYSTKVMFPEIGKIFKKHSKQASDMLDPSITPIIEMYEKQDTLEARIVKFADVLSIIQYTRQEVMLGNMYMKVIYEETQEIIEDMVEALKEHKR